MPASTTAPSKSPVGFEPVPLSSLRPDHPIPFRLYLQISGCFIQHQGRDAILDDFGQEELLGMNVDTLWVPLDELDEYLTYLSEHLSFACNQPSHSSEKKIGRCYNSGIAVTRQALTRPERDKALTAAEQVVAVATRLLEREGYRYSRLAKVLTQQDCIFDHSMRVCLYGLLLGHHVGYEPIETLGVALLYHDAGKLDVPARILQKQGPLTSEDWKQVTQHPSLGLKRTKVIERLPDVAQDVIQNHHEKLDGSGYPRGLDGADLSPATRIASIVNHFDSRTSQRPHRDARATLDVIRAMMTNESSRFDADYLRAFLELLAD